VILSTVLEHASRGLSAIAELLVVKWKNFQILLLLGATSISIKQTQLIGRLSAFLNPRIIVNVG